MRFWKLITHLLLTVLLAFGANGVVSAKVASGDQNLIWTAHQADGVFNWLTHQGKSARSTTGPPGSPVATKGGIYKLRDADGVVRRTGKSNNLDRRRGEHARNKETKDLDFEVDRRTDCCNAQRGREQIIYDQHPEAQAAIGGLNKRRPVSPTNPKRDIYRKAGEKL